jgi:hypothetical protein
MVSDGKKNIILVLFIIPVCLLAQSPYWDKAFGTSVSDCGTSVCNVSPYDKTGGYMLAGYGNSANYPKARFFRINDYGEPLWDNPKSYGPYDDDVCIRAITLTSDKGFICLGNSHLTGLPYLIKLNANGDSLWAKYTTQPAWTKPRSIQQTADGGYIFADGWLGYLVKTDADGDIVWLYQYTPAGYTSSGLWDVQLTADGKYIVVGELKGSSTDFLFIVKVDTDGSYIWRVYHDFGSGECGRSIQQIGDSYIITGTSNDSVFLAKTNSTGGITWNKSYGGAGEDIGWSVRATPDNGFIIGADTRSFGGDLDVYLIKTDESGNEMWAKTWGGSDEDGGL